MIRTRHVLAYALLAALLVSLTLAGRPSDPPVPVASGPSIAQQWFDTQHVARQQGIRNLIAFYDPDVVIEGARAAHGRSEALEHLEDMLPPEVYRRDMVQGVFLGPTGAVTLERITSTGSMVPEYVVFLHEMGPLGIIHEMMAASIQAWRRYGPGDVRLLAVDRLVRRYLARGSAAEDGLELTDLPDFGGPAIFVAGAEDERVPLRSVVLLAEQDAGAGCPGSMAIVLHLDSAGRITREQRLPLDRDQLRCSDPGAPPAGWWDSIVIPEPVSRILTGEVPLGGDRVPVFNSTPGLDALLVWGHDRFRQAGMEPPALSEVTFLAREVDLCRGITGMALEDSLSLCFDEGDACASATCASWRPWARTTLLHELAHVWMTDHVSHAQQAAFIDRAGLPTWADTDHPWAQRGVELAASTIAAALGDEPLQVSRLFGQRSCAELKELLGIVIDPMPTLALRCVAR